MKMRKILAVLFTLAMLCTLLPLGAISVAAEDETIVSWDFEDGNVGLTSGTGQSIVVDPDNSSNHVLYWQGASAWGVIYKVITLEKNTDYAIDFKVKTSAGGSAYITWEVASWGTYDQKSFSTKTTWTEQHIEFNTGGRTVYDRLKERMHEDHEGAAHHEGIMLILDRNLAKMNRLSAEIKAMTDMHK